MFVDKKLLLLCALALAGCAFYPSLVDDRMGASVKSAGMLQSVNPGPRPGPPLALDGEAAKFAVDRYQRSFERPQPPVNVFNIGVGNASTSGGSGTR